MRSNIKAKPGSQGTLFRPASKSLLNPQQRWPKGYTPERLNEVRSALKDTAVHADPEYVGIEEEDHAGRTRVETQHRPRVEQAIARSTVPVEHLQGLSEIHDHVDEGTVGTYWPAKRLGGPNSLAVDMSGYHVDSREAEGVLIHELGHHHDFEHSLDLHRVTREVSEKHAWKDKGPYQQKPTQSGVYQAESKVRAGVAEATADNYFTEHYRTPGRNPQRVTKGQYENNFTTDRLDQKYPGYTDVRPAQHMGPQFKTDPLPGKGQDMVDTEKDRAWFGKQAAQRNATQWATQPNLR
jgi:hypothetical protein